jgi:hypothetical protein
VLLLSLNFIKSETSSIAENSSLPTKREVTQNPRDSDQGLRSARTNKKQSGDHTRKTEGHQTKRSISYKDTKMPKVIKSASSIEKQRLDILPNPKKANPKVTKSHQDSHSNNSKASAKASFWGSPDISSGIEKLFEVMGLYNKSKTLIISMNLCSIKNIIQLSNLNLHDLGNMFSRQDLRDSVLQDSILKVLCLGECFKTTLRSLRLQQSLMLMTSILSI